MSEAVRAVGGDRLAGLRRYADAGAAVDRSGVADESNRAAARVEDVPVLSNDVVRNCDRA